MLRATPFDMFEPNNEGFTKSAVNEAAAIIQNTIDEFIEYTEKEEINNLALIEKEETDNHALMRIDYSWKRASMIAVVDLIDNMHKFMNQQYITYMASRNREVEEVLGWRRAIRGYEQHLVKYNHFCIGISIHVKSCELKIAEAVNIDREFIAAFCSRMRGFKNRFRSYFNVILDFHARPYIEMEKKIYSGRKKRYEDEIGNLVNCIELYKDELKVQFEDVRRKSCLLYDLRRMVFLRKNVHTLSDVEVFKSKIQQMEISGLMETCKNYKETSRETIKHRLRKLKRLAWSCYAFEVVTEAVRLKDKTIDLNQIEFMCPSEKLEEMLAWLEDEFSCLISRCSVLKKESYQTLRRIEDIKAELCREAHT